MDIRDEKHCTETVEHFDNYLQLCRLCLRKETSVSLYSGCRHPLRYVDIALSLLTIQINQADSMPQSICDQCTKKLLHFYEFKQECEASDQKLKCFHRDVTIKIEPSDPLTIVDTLLNDEINYTSDASIKSEENELPANELASYKCNVCGQSFERQVNLQKHVCIHKPKVINYKCKNCGKSFVRLKELKAHKSKSCTRSKLSRQSHKQNENDKVHLDTHSPTTLGNNANKTTDQNQRKKGQRTHKLHTVKSECSSDNILLATPSSANGHEIMNETATRTNGMNLFSQQLFSCKICNETFPKIGRLYRHRKLYHADNSKPTFRCTKCHKKFVREMDLQIHISKTHRWMFPLTCDCGIVFTNNRSFTEHVCSIRRFECFLCHLVLRSLDKLKIHIRNHRKQKYMCEICGKTFSERYLKTHNETIHFKNQHLNFECDICKKRFLTKDKIRAHMLFHRPEQPHACDFCGKKFYHKSHVRAHAVIHSDVRNHECALCHKRYRRAWDLTKHMNEHYKNKIYRCNLCEKSYLARTKVTRHLNINHKIFKDYNLYLTLIKN